LAFPTAVQAKSPEQETARSPPFGTSGPDWIDQLVPFQSSISGLAIAGGAGGEFGTVPQ